MTIKELAEMAKSIEPGHWMHRRQTKSSEAAFVHGGGLWYALRDDTTGAIIAIQRAADGIIIQTAPPTRQAVTSIRSWADPDGVIYWVYGRSREILIESKNRQKIQTIINNLGLQTVPQRLYDTYFISTKQTQPAAVMAYVPAEE